MAVGGVSYETQSLNRAGWEKVHKKVQINNWRYKNSLFWVCSIGEWFGLHSKRPAALLLNNMSTGVTKHEGCVVELKGG